MDPTLLVALVAAGSAILGSAVGSLAPVWQSSITRRAERIDADATAHDQAEREFVDAVLHLDAGSMTPSAFRLQVRVSALRLRPHLARRSAFYRLVEAAYANPDEVTSAAVWAAIDADAQQ